MTKNPIKIKGMQIKIPAMVFVKTKANETNAVAIRNTRKLVSINKPAFFRVTTF